MIYFLNTTTDYWIILGFISLKLDKIKTRIFRIWESCLILQCIASKRHRPCVHNQVRTLGTGR